MIFGHLSINISTNQSKYRFVCRSYSSVRKLLVFHRHGDRAPFINIYESIDASKAAAEEQIWFQKMPDQHTLRRLDTLFPAKSEAEEEPKDLQHFPFGCLTATGIDQLKDLGKSIRNHYGKDFTALKAMSTNFARTQQSVQSFLDGFTEGTGGVAVEIRGNKNDFLYPFESNRDKVFAAMKEVDQCPIFLAEDLSKRELRDKILAALPGLENHMPLFWIHATDYFSCHNAHNIEIPSELQEVEDATFEYLAWRYWYRSQNKKLLKLLAQPLMEEVYRQRNQTVSNIEQGDKGENALHVYGVHDVTILAMLYALGASEITSQKGWWPPYASNLVFEIQESKDQSAGQKVTTNIFFNSQRLNLDHLLLEQHNDDIVKEEF